MKTETQYGETRTNECLRERDETDSSRPGTTEVWRARKYFYKEFFVLFLLSLTHVFTQVSGKP